MKPGKKAALLILIVAFVAAAAGAGLFGGASFFASFFEKGARLPIKASEEGAAVSPPFDAPPFDAPPFDATAFVAADAALKKLQGRPVLLNFWASWCLPCREEFPELLKAAEWGEGRFVMLLVSEDASKKDMERFLRDFPKVKKAPNISLARDPERKLAESFHVAKLPETFALDKNGLALKKWAGAFVFEEARPDLERLASSGRE